MAHAPTTVAVLAFDSTDASHAAGAADGCVIGVLEAGVRAVERQRVADVLSEREESRSGEVSAEYYRRLGEMLGADAFLIGSITQGDFGYARTVTVRLVSTETGDVALVATIDRGEGAREPGVLGQRACRALLGGAP